MTPRSLGNRCVPGVRATSARQLRRSNVSNSGYFIGTSAFRALTAPQGTFTHPRLASKLPQNGPTPPPTPNLTSKNAPFGPTTAHVRPWILLNRPSPTPKAAKQQPHQGSRNVAIAMGWPVTSPQASSIRPPHRCRVRTHVLQGLRLKA